MFKPSSPQDPSFENSSEGEEKVKTLNYSCTEFLPQRVRGHAWDTPEGRGATSHPRHLTKALPCNTPPRHNAWVSPGAHRDARGTMGENKGQQLPRTIY